MSEKIRECPLCGGAPVLIEYSYEGEPYARVECSCGCRGAEGVGNERHSEAVRSWNHRPREERLVKLLNRCSLAI